MNRGRKEGGKGYLNKRTSKRVIECERASEWEIKGIDEWVVFFDFNLHNYGSNDAR